MKYIYLPEKYHLVVGDKFELFYRGIIKLNNPYEYYIFVRCPKGRPFPRYFTFTPELKDIGEYELTVELIDNNLNVIERGTTTLIVESPEKPQNKLNVLCFGDSLTVNGVWPKEGYRRFCKEEGNPNGLGFNDTLNFIGTCTVEESNDTIGYEGYGGWTWKSYCTADHIGLNSSIWIYTKHNKTDSDQHTVWKSNGYLWILETIEKDRLKFKRGTGNISMVSNIGDKLEHVENAVHTEDIIIDSYEYEKTNPFWSKTKSSIDLIEYCERNNFDKPDLIYILLTWNGLWQPYNHNFNHHFDYTKEMLRHIHQVLPHTKVTLLGIQICSVNGGIASNYGASGPYSDTFGSISTAFHYNEQLEALTKEDEFKDFVDYVDIKSQFDSEYNMPSSEIQVNARNPKTELIGNNGVHPNMYGYLQIGDAFYRKLVHDVKKINKGGV